MRTAGPVPRLPPARCSSTRETWRPPSASCESCPSMCDSRQEYTRRAGHGGRAMRVFLPLAAGLLAASPLHAAAAPPGIPVKALFANPAYFDPDLSDDGSQIAFIQSNGDLWVVVAQAIEGGR